MAEIHIERKKNVWPWVIALIVLVLLIWGAFAIRDNEGALTPVPTATAPDTAVAPAAPEAVPADDMVGDAMPPPADETPPPAQ